MTSTNTKTALEKVTSALPDALRGDLHTRIEFEKQNIIDALIDLALGACFIDTATMEDGTRVPKSRVYTKLPDKEVAQYLLNQVIGKPKENVQIQGRVNFIMDQ